MTALPAVMLTCAAPPDTCQAACSRRSSPPAERRRRCGRNRTRRSGETSGAAPSAPPTGTCGSALRLSSTGTCISQGPPGKPGSGAKRCPSVIPKNSRNTRIGRVSCGRFSLRTPLRYLAGSTTAVTRNPLPASQRPFRVVSGVPSTGGPGTSRRAVNAPARGPTTMSADWKPSHVPAMENHAL